MREILLDDKSDSEYYIKETEREAVVITLRYGRFGARIFDREKIIFFPQNAQTGSGAHIVSYSVSTGGSS